MNYREMQKKYLGLIEEVSPNHEDLTEDEDLAAKQIEVTNQIMFELARHKKIPKYVELDVAPGQIVTFTDIAEKCGFDVYQIKAVGGVRHVKKADGTVHKFLEPGTAEIEVYVYPRRIPEGVNPEDYKFDLSADVLEIMPYGIAADLLKSDESADFGTAYAKRYKDMLEQLDPRYQLLQITYEGGVQV